MENGETDRTPSVRTARDRQLFDRIAAEYCRKDLAPASRCARRHRLEASLGLVEIDGTKDILEVGCGAGFSAAYLQGKYRSYVGIDHSPRFIELASEINGSVGVTFEVADAGAYEPLRRFDVIFMIGVLHHLSEPVATLKHLSSLLKPGGFIVVNEPHDANPAIELARRLRGRLDASYSIDQVTYGRRSICALMSSAGLRVVKIKPQGLFSTPFAEVVLPLGPLMRPLSATACRVDRWVESVATKALQPLSWNLMLVAEHEVAPAAAKD